MYIGKTIWLYGVYFFVCKTVNATLMLIFMLILYANMTADLPIMTL